MALNDETEDFYPFKKRAGKGKRRGRMRENAHVTPLRVVEDNDVLEDFTPHSSTEEITMTEKEKDLEQEVRDSLRVGDEAETDSTPRNSRARGHRSRKFCEEFLASAKGCKSYKDLQSRINLEGLALQILDRFDDQESLKQFLDEELEFDIADAKLMFEKSESKKKETSSSSSSSSDGFTTTETVVVGVVAAAAAYGVYKALENPTPASGFATGAGWG